MSILDNEGHDPNGFGNRPTLGSIERAYQDGYAAAQAEIERLRAILERIAGGDGYYPDLARTALYADRPNQRTVETK